MHLNMLGRAEPVPLHDSFLQNTCTKVAGACSPDVKRQE